MIELIEVTPFEYSFTEATREQKQEGILGKVKGGSWQRSDVQNANDRIYSKKLWERVLNDTSIQETIKNRSMAGELDHPASGATSLDRISHLVTGLEIDKDGIVTGEAEILDTPHGRILETLFRAKVKVGVSSRGKGNVKNVNGKNYVDEDSYKFETFDMVLKPSTSGAYPTLTENEIDQLLGVCETFSNNEDINILNETQKILNMLPDSDNKNILLEKIKNNLIEFKYEKNMEDNNMLPLEETKVNPNIEGLARDLAAKQISDLEEEHFKTIAEKDNQIAFQASELDELKVRYNAAEQIIEELLNKVQEVKESSLEEAENNHQDIIVATRLLLEQALLKAQELAVYEARYEAAGQLLSALLERRSDEQLSNYIDSITSNLPENKREYVSNILESCASIDDVDNMWESLQNIVSISSNQIYTNSNPLPHLNIEESILPTTRQSIRSRLDENVNASQSVLISKRLQERFNKMNGIK